MDLHFLQWFGYAASLIIAVSMTMSSIVKFRWINISGASLFFIYGITINAIPVCILNGFIVLVDIYYLTKIYSKKEKFEILEINAGNEYVKRFLKFHDARIQKILPGFAYNPDMNTVSFFILRDMAVAGLFLAHRENGNVLKVGLDFVLPEYKDFKNGKHVYFNLRKNFIDAGYTSVMAESKNLSYIKYLKKLEFTENEKGIFSKEL